MNDICDGEMKNEFEKLKYYDLLNSEKITPSFLKILRGGGTSSKLSDILGPDGNNFASEADRTDYIVDFLKTILLKFILTKNKLLLK